MRENQSIGKAVAVLREVSRHPNGVSASELARRTSISRVTVARLAATLAQHQMLTRQSDDRYVLGSEVARLGRLADHDQLVISALEPGLRELRDTFDEAVTLELPRGLRRIETVFQLNPSYVMTPNWVGQEIDLHASSAGKVFLAFSQPSIEHAVDQNSPLVARTKHTITERTALLEHLAEVRNRGVANTHEEYELELTGVSVPVFTANDSSELLAILSVTGPTWRLEPQLDEAAFARLRAVGSAMSGSWAATL
jgi:DNA-binding IclR family transcriptional regulator